MATILSTPQRPVEVFFAAIVPPRHLEDNYRYLVLEAAFDTAPAKPIGVLCEWFADGKRRNREWRMPADRAIFERAIAEQVR